MKKMLLLTLVLIVATSAIAAPGMEVPGVPQGYASANKTEVSGFYFNSDNEGWQMDYVGMPSGATYETLYPVEPALWSSTLGDPIGSVYQTVGTDRDQRAYWLGFVGDHGFMGDINGQMLQCNVYSTGNWTTISRDNGGAGDDDGNVYARWVIARESDAGGAWAMYISNRNVSLDMNSFSGWTTFAVDVNDMDFTRWPNSPDPGPSFMDVMADYDQIGLYLFSGTDDMNDVNGSGTTWFNDAGTSRLQHYGASATSGDATWAIDNTTKGDDVVTTESTTFDGVKALYR